MHDNRRSPGYIVGTFIGLFLLVLVMLGLIRLLVWLISTF